MTLQRPRERADRRTRHDVGPTDRATRSQPEHVARAQNIGERGPDMR